MTSLTTLTLVWVLAASALGDAEPPRGGDAPRPFVPVNLSLVPPLALDPTGDARSLFALNVPIGVSGALTGLEVSAILGVRAEAAGLLVAGGASWLDRELVGAQVAGGISRAGTVRGVQVAGGASWSSGAVTGFQISGGLNRAAGVLGAQLAGGLNVATELRGLQVAPVNVAGAVQGAQVGVVNVSDSCAVAVGVVNVARTCAATVGLVNVVQNGYARAVAWGTETVPVNVGVKTGGSALYTLLGVGHRLTDPERGPALSAGLGTHLVVGPTFIEVEALATWFFTHAFENRHAELLSTLRALVGLELTGSLGVFAGPTLNVGVAWGGTSLDMGLGLEQSWTRGTTEVRLYPGFAFGVQY